MHDKNSTNKQGTILNPFLVLWRPLQRGMLQHDSVHVKTVGVARHGPARPVIVLGKVLAAANPPPVVQVKYLNIYIRCSIKLLHVLLLHYHASGPVPLNLLCCPGSCLKDLLAVLLVLDKLVECDLLRLGSEADEVATLALTLGLGVVPI